MRKQLTLLARIPAVRIRRVVLRPPIMSAIESSLLVQSPYMTLDLGKMTRGRHSTRAGGRESARMSNVIRALLLGRLGGGIQALEAHAPTAIVDDLTRA